MPSRMGIASVVILGIAAFGAASSASAANRVFGWAPVNTTSHVRGTLLFVPLTGGPPFRCKVEWTVKTGNIPSGPNHLPTIPSARAYGKGCNNVFFRGTPWGLGATNLHTGVFGSMSFEGSDGSTCNQSEIAFKGLPNGDWTISPGNCLVGKLTSDPPIKIIPTKP
jgi:hypothetical protein